METKERLRKDDSSGISKVEPRDSSSLRFIPDFFVLRKLVQYLVLSTYYPKFRLLKLEYYFYKKESRDDDGKVDT